MIRVAIVNQEDKVVRPDELTTMTELQQAVEQARNLIRECERQAVARAPQLAVRRAPYS